MFYVKNVPTVERVLRVVTGIIIIACGLLFFKGLMLGYLIAASGIMTILTGFFGFCPMCYMAGRKLK